MKAPGMAAGRTAPVDIALKLLSKALDLGDIADEQGKAILDMLRIGVKHFGKPSGDVTRAELKMLNDSAPSVSPANPQAFQQAMKQQGAAQVRPMPQASPAPVAA